MNTTKWKGYWNVIKGKLKQTFGQLNDDILTHLEGIEDERWGKIQIKVGHLKQEILKEIDYL